jgi:hypothetical protein
MKQVGRVSQARPTYSLGSMIFVLTISLGALWLTVSVLVLAVCRMAAGGDEALARDSEGAAEMLSADAIAEGIKVRARTPARRRGRDAEAWTWLPAPGRRLTSGIDVR